MVQHFATPGACVDSLIAEVKAYAGGCERMDDATAVLLRSR
jgi:hypothetical protein